MKTWPVKFGFISDPRECIGKTITEVEIMKMPFGCTWKSAIVTLFSDGERAFFVGGVGSGVVSPSRKEIEKSRIFSPEELGEITIHDRKDAERREAERKQAKLRQIKQLQKEVGES